MPAVTFFVAYAPTSSYNEEEIEAFYMDLGKFYRKDRTFYKPVINWGLFTSLAGFWEDTVVDNIDEVYDRLVQHLRDSAKKAEGSRTTKRRVSYEALELIRQRGGARAAGNYQLTSELAKRCREAIKEDLKERRAAVLAEASETGKSIRNTRRDLANRKAKMKDAMLFVSLEWTESTGRLWHAIGINGRIAGARSVYPKINGSQGDQGFFDNGMHFHESEQQLHRNPDVRNEARETFALYTEAEAKINSDVTTFLR
ncbi:hypothetical protein ANCDUO_09043 [Ancylostoma duodenale]|uniref:Uncharacterized protein n=1 Tax=Ancylostoma duodenale TaxID=51022 RepID=A0A0C2GU26_9BILA|nr:hypothetical protein ANCDUO_09043 [Ancylostoma duodenale]